MKLKCEKCGAIFNEIGGKISRDGDVTQWCPECGASDDHIIEQPIADCNVAIQINRK